MVVVQRETLVVDVQCRKKKQILDKMERGKIIVIEGTDCSGKETQAKILYEKLRLAGIPIEKMSFPRYNTPPGRIVGGPYLGKPEICEGWFPEGATSVDSKVASLFYAADRRYALPEIREVIESGKNLLLDRYVASNMGHQGGKVKDPEERKRLYEFLEELEYDLLELPKPDLTVFLYMPPAVGMELKKGRVGAADQHESSLEHLKNAEQAYLELADRYSWTKIGCAPDGTVDSLKSPEKVSEEVWNLTSEFFR